VLGYQVSQVHAASILWVVTPCSGVLRHQSFGWPRLDISYFGWLTTVRSLSWYSILLVVLDFQI